MSGIGKNIFRAGIIPFFVNEDGSIQFMFMKPSDPAYGGPDWQIAKGRVEGEDDNMTTALCEGAEELGLKESNIKSIQELGQYLGRTTVYICEVSDMDDFTDFTYETGAVKWMSANDFIKEGRDIHRDIVSDALNVILNDT